MSHQIIFKSSVSAKLSKPTGQKISKVRKQQFCQSYCFIVSDLVYIPTRGDWGSIPFEIQIYELFQVWYFQGKCKPTFVLNRNFECWSSIKYINALWPFQVPSASLFNWKDVKFFVLKEFLRQPSMYMIVYQNLPSLHLHMYEKDKVHYLTEL